MHAFVVTKDGRAYTAISRVPDEISSEMMTLNTIGGVVGWMFALQGGPGAKNGFMFTGKYFKAAAKILQENQTLENCTCKKFKIQEIVYIND
jgi:nidogen (entactin)